jgi:hypothetical protein
MHVEVYLMKFFVFLSPGKLIEDVRKNGGRDCQTKPKRLDGKTSKRLVKLVAQ